MASTSAAAAPLRAAPSPVDRAAAVVDACQALQGAAIEAVRQRVAPAGELDPELMIRDQRALHGLAWLATYVEALRQMLAWAVRLDAAGGLGELERLLLETAFAEYLARIRGGIPISQVELVRPADFGLGAAQVDAILDPVPAGIDDPREIQARLATLIEDGATGASGFASDDLELIGGQIRRFVDDRVVPEAQRWHLEDALIPLEVIEALAGMGVFGLTLPEDWGGLGLGKEAMCVVTEELSRGSLAVGSLGTRSEIAAELILANGTDEQRRRYLPRIASGETIPTAVFTEPDTGSDLASLKTRARRDGDVFRITGAKTWITHAARADLMTVLCRTDPDARGYRGLSILLAEKPRATAEDDFPVAGLSGGEIPVLGYRGMREYTLSFDGFEVPATGLLGGVEGQGFKQLMATFEAARVQTAARGLGVARSALELGLRYALERRQFGRPLFAFPRISGKLTSIAAELMLARQLTLFAARQKDAGRRCDLEAGMAKLLAAQVAWSAADAALQIHGGNGYALEYPISRVLCDARILSIFEGTAEIQAQVIARRLLGN
ncbi:MAG TPA: acyl-CoA dehydrogenase family protein [Geminicoccaceae bacterium]